MSYRTLETLRSKKELAESKPHGTRMRYIGGCKCLKCRMANANYARERMHARAAGDTRHIVRADAARTHLLWLAAHGCGRHMISAACGVSSTSLWAIKRGEKAKIRANTERKILAVTVEAARGDAFVLSAARTKQLIGRLLEEGYTKTHIAKALGYRTPALQIGITGHVTLRNAHRVETLYRKLTE